MINFPLYMIRANYSIFEEGAYVCVLTQKTKYVLDYKLKTDAFSKRRVRLLNDPNKPYRIYPLKVRVDSISQMLLCKSKIFIDATGKVFRWKPKKFYKVECKLISSYWTTPTGYTGIEVDGHKFIVSNYKLEKYARIVRISPFYSLLFDISDVRLPDTRKKI